MFPFGSTSAIAVAAADWKNAASAAAAAAAVRGANCGRRDRSAVHVPALQEASLCNVEASLPRGRVDVLAFGEEAVGVAPEAVEANDAAAARER